MRQRFLLASTTAMLGSLVVLQTVAFAQAPEIAAGETATESGEEEIIVTAEKRSSSLQKVPTAISALGKRAIEDSRIESLESLQRVTPGLTFSQVSGTSAPNLRGLGFELGNASGEASVITQVDGVYIARPTAVGSILGDLERIEVLRGPQGTLYGRNATGGVINYITRTPDEEFGGSAGVTFGSHGRIQANAGIEGALGEAIRGRLSLYTDNNDGDQRNPFLDVRGRVLESWGTRGVLVFDASPTLQFTLRGDYYDEDLKNPQMEAIAYFPAASAVGVAPNVPGGILQDVLGIPPALPPIRNGRDINTNLPDAFMKREAYGLGLTTDWSPEGESWKLKSITAWRESRFERRLDTDASTAPVLEELFAPEYSTQFTQEFNISGEGSNGATWLLGAYYFHEKLDYEYNFAYTTTGLVIDALFGLPSGTTDPALFVEGTQTTNSYSLFGQAKAPITDSFSIIAGLRYNYDTKDERQTIRALGNDICRDLVADDSWDEISWNIAAEYTVTDQNLLYAGVAKGFKAGGFNVGGCNDPFDSEIITSYSIGSKNTFFDGKLTVNVDAFYYDYTDLQVAVFIPTGSSVENAADAKIYGAELELKARPVEGLELTAGISLLHTEFDNFQTLDPLNPPGGIQDVSGNRLQHSADFTASGSAAYTHSIGNGEITWRYEIYHSDGWYGDVFNNPLTRQEPYTLHNANITYAIDGYELGVFGENLSDEVYATNLFASGGPGVILAEYGFRRRYGIFARVDF